MLRSRLKEIFDFGEIGILYTYGSNFIAKIVIIIYHSIIILLSQ